MWWECGGRFVVCCCDGEVGCVAEKMMSSC